MKNYCQIVCNKTTRPESHGLSLQCGTSVCVCDAATTADDLLSLTLYIDRFIQISSSVMLRSIYPATQSENLFTKQLFLAGILSTLMHNK